MSLIIDALKKTQQLRSNEFQKPQISRYPSPEKRRNSRKQWLVIGAGFVSLCILLSFSFKSGSSPLSPQNRGPTIPIEKKSYIPVAEKTPSEPSKGSLNLLEAEPSVPVSYEASSGGWPDPGQAATQEHSPSGIAHRGPSSPHAGEKVLPKTKPPLVDKRRGSIAKQTPPLLPAAAGKEEVSPKSIGVEQEGKKDHLLASEVLNHFNAGVSFYNQKEFSKAIQAYQKVIEVNPAYVEAYNNLGIVYQATGDLDGALGAYRKSIEINPKYEKGYNNLGLLLMLEGHYEEAAETFQFALAVNPNNIESHINLGILFKKKEQWEKAIESYQRALAIDPLHRETHYNIALLYEQLERMELAMNHYRQFIRLSSKSYPDLVTKVQRHLDSLMKTGGSK